MNWQPLHVDPECLREARPGRLRAPCVGRIMPFIGTNMSPKGASRGPQWAPKTRRAENLIEWDFA